MNTVRRFAIAGSLTVLGIAAVPGYAAATSVTTIGVGTAAIRSAHFSPDTGGVDVYLTTDSTRKTTLWQSGETYGKVTSYLAVRPGVYDVAIRPHGASSASSALLSWKLNAEAGRAYTVAAVGVGSARKGAVLGDDLQPPPPGSGRIRLIQAASAAPRADVSAIDGPVVASEAPFATSSGYAQVPAGTWQLKASSTVDPNLTITMPVSVRAGSVNSIVLLDKPGGGLNLEAVVDSAAAARVPSGSVDAGGGGTAATVTDARSSGGGWAWGLGGGAAAAALGTAYALRRRRQADQRSIS